MSSHHTHTGHGTLGNTLGVAVALAVVRWFEHRRVPNSLGCTCVGRGWHRDSQYKIDELDNEIRKYKNDSDMLREKVDFANKRLEAQKLYYEDQMKKLSMD